jgi:hypothetical protein
MNYYLSCLSSNIEEACRKEDRLSNYILDIKSKSPKYPDVITDADIDGLEGRVIEAAVRVHAVEALRMKILEEESDLIKKDVNSSVLDSIRARREPLFNEYDELLVRLNGYDGQIEGLCNELGIDCVALVETELLKLRQPIPAETYKNAAEIYEKVKSQISQQK